MSELRESFEGQWRGLTRPERGIVGELAAGGTDLLSRAVVEELGTAKSTLAEARDRLVATGIHLRRDGSRCRGVASPAMQSIYPVLIYEDCPAAIEFLERAFGFERHAVHEGADGAVAHGELRLGDELIMVSSSSEGDERFNQVVGKYSLYVAVDDPDAHHERAKAAGATIDRPLEDQDYGSRDYTARDPEDNLWSFGTYRPEL